MAPEAHVDWPSFLRQLGLQERRARELLGLSQTQLARLAGVSQAAVSRLERGRGLTTRLLIVVKVNLALRRGLEAIDPGLVREGLSRNLDLAHELSTRGEAAAEAGPLPRADAGLEELLRLYGAFPEERRPVILALVRAAASSLAAAGRRQKPGGERNAVADAGAGARCGNRAPGPCGDEPVAV
jgi:transcriptional regulator with XRE-family HTH domain